MPGFAPNINLSEIREHQLSQYQDSTRLNALLQGFIDLFNDQVVAHLEAMDRVTDVTNQSGFFLDWVGVRLGMVRPRIEDPNLVYFGLDGTQSEGGRALSQAPFWTADRSNDLFQPIGDPAYKLVILARTRKLHGDLGLEAWQECFQILSRDGGGINIVEVTDFSVKIQYFDLAAEIRVVMQDTILGPKILPMVPGIAYEWQESYSTQPISFSTRTNQPDWVSTA